MDEVGQSENAAPRALQEIRFYFVGRQSGQPETRRDKRLGCLLALA